MVDLYSKALEQKSRTSVHGKLEHESLGIQADDKDLHVRRDKIDIILKILEITTQPTKKTHILYTAKINFYQLSGYLDLLLKIGMVEEISYPLEGYRITEKGRVLLKLFEQTRSKEHNAAASELGSRLQRI